VPTESLCYPLCLQPVAVAVARVIVAAVQGVGLLHPTAAVILLLFDRFCKKSLI
jgi:hypothetical protein